MVPCMTPTSGITVLLILAALTAPTTTPGHADEARPIPAPAEALKPAAPVLPAEVVAALQEGRFQEAADALQALETQEGATEEDRSYYSLIKGVALRLDGKLPEARAALAAALEKAPRGLWTSKLRAELAACEIAANRFAEAEELARTQTVLLLDPGRKDALAGVYEAFARTLSHPSDPVLKPDFEGAHALLEQGRKIARGEAARARILLNLARLSQSAGNHPRAIEEFTLYQSEHAGADLPGADMDAARYGLGEAQLAAGQALNARLTWSDLVREPRVADSPEVPRARFGISRTYGMPAPADDTALNLGVAALQRFLEAHPANENAPRASYEIGAAYLHRGKSDEAYQAFRNFLDGKGFRAESDQARRDLAELTMTACYQVGQILQGQGKFDPAIAAFQDYLARFPDGPQSADAQRAILDTRLLKAADLDRQEKHDEARAAWREFVAAYPLDPRVPETLLRVATSYLEEKKYDEAITAWELVAARFPGTEPAGHAQFETAMVLENQKADHEAALALYRKIEVEPWKSQAAQRVALMEARSLTVVTPRTFRSGETPQLRISTRNIENLTLTAYRLDPETYFRKKNSLSGVEGLDIGLVAPDEEWTAAIPGYKKYLPIESDYELKLEVPGVYVVKVTDETTLQATTLVLGSDIDAIFKSSAEEGLVFVQDMKTGRGRPNARVMVSDGSQVILDSRTGDDGVLHTRWEHPRAGSERLSFLVLDGVHAASNALGVPESPSRGISPRAYLYTDRPAYRPGQTVQVRGVVREVEEGQYAVKKGAEYRLELTDSRGRPFLVQPVVLSEFGTFSATASLDDAAPVGDYRIRLYQPGKSDFTGGFQVQAYQLEKVELSFDMPQTVYYRGETVKGAAVARYQYGTPLAARQIALQLPDGRVLSGLTDAAGRFPFELDTEGFGEARLLDIAAQLPQDNVSAVVRVAVAVQGFSIALETRGSVFLDGESFRLEARTSDALGKPTGQELTLRVIKIISRPSKMLPGAYSLSEREEQRHTLRTGAEDGKADLTLKIDDREGGRYVLRAAGTDRFGNAVVTDHPLTISGEKDEEKLRILTDRQEFKVGEPAKVNLLNRGPAGVALLAWEADRILQYRLVPLEAGQTAIEWAVEDAQFPNFTLTASRMTGSRFDTARLDVLVRRDLVIRMKPSREAVGPGDELSLEIETTNQLGKPVAAELSVALVDEALLRRFPDTRPPIGGFFHDQTRTGSFASESTNTFAYRPATIPVPRAAVEDEARQQAQLADEAGRADALAEAQNQVAFDLPAAAPPAPAGAAGGMGGAAILEKRAGRKAKDKEESGASAEGYAGEPGQGQAGMYRWSGRLDEDGRAAWEDATSSLFGLSQAEAKALGARDASRRRQPRQAFMETAYWNPTVVTDAAGKVRVTLKAPSALSRYRFLVRGATGADTLVGQGSTSVMVKQDFFVELKRPAVVTQGDKVRLIGRVHHAGVKGPVEVRLKTYAGGREQVFPLKLDVTGDGVDELLFEPLEIPDGDIVRVTLSAQAGDAVDELVEEIPIRPYGLQAFASASGSSSTDATAFIALAPGRTYQEPEMLIALSPSPRRMLVDLALGSAVARERLEFGGCIRIPPATVLDRAGELLAAAAVLEALRADGGSDAPEASRLADRIRGLASELLTLQNEDGGWPWVAGESGRPSDRMASARAFWALSTIQPLGLLADTTVLERGGTYLTAAFNAADAADSETRSALLHALSTRRLASFEAANALNRGRAGLSDASLALLALTFVNLDRTNLAIEVLGVLTPRAKIEEVGPGLPSRRYWEGASRNPALRGTVQATALAALAYAKALPEAPELRGAADWLTAHRVPTGWDPHHAQGPALAALAAYHRHAERSADRYRLSVKVNDQEVQQIDADGRTSSITIPVPQNVLKVGDRNVIRFDIEGRGTFAWSATLTGFTREFGPEQDPANKPFRATQHIFLPDAPELDGRTLPTGFDVAVGATYFENWAHHVGLGGRVRVRIDAHRVTPQGQPSWERDYLVLEDHLPAGTTLVEGSVQSAAQHVELGDGVIRFYFAPDQEPGQSWYDVYGYIPGHYRVVPPVLSSAYEPGRRVMPSAGVYELEVLTADQKNPDPYKPTPRELYARGKAHFDAGRFAEAEQALEALWSDYTLTDEIAKDTARMLLLVHLKAYDPRSIVQYFEILKEKMPELVLPFDQVLIVGRAYRDLGEFERAYLVWKALSEASYLEDARLGELLRQRGQSLPALALLIDLWREYPGSASIESDFLGIAQLAGRSATRAITDPGLRRELAEAGKTRAELLLQSIRLTQVFLSLYPRNPLADEASLALIGSFLDLEDFEAVVKLSTRYARLYPKSSFADSFQYSEALGRFHLGEFDRAIEIAQKIAESKYTDANGVEQPSPNKWQALYIIGQIHDARRHPAQAVTYYEQVAEHFTDAAEAARIYKRKGLSLPEVTVIRPADPAAAANALRAIPPREKDSEDEGRVTLKYRNIRAVEVKVYPVDLRRLYLSRRNLDGIAGIDLAGITPLLEKTVELGDGQDFDDRSTTLDLSLEREGAYLVMVRGDELYASGVVLVSPLKMEVTEEPAAGRVRIRVKDAASGALLPKVNVRVIGSENPDFFSGETDLRGVYVAEGVRGQVTALARTDAMERKDSPRYAFYRGSSYVGVPAAPAPPTDAAKPTDTPAQAAPMTLEQNVQMQNSANQMRQIERLEQRYNAAPQGGADLKGFK